MAGNAKIGALHVSLGLNSAQFETGLKKSQSSLANFGKFAVTAFKGVALAATAAATAMGFAVKSVELVDAFHAAGVAHGGTTCEDPPGYREGPAGKLYLAYLRDLDGNKLCAVYRPG